MKSLFIGILLLIPSAYSGVHVQNQWSKNHISVCFADEPGAVRTIGNFTITTRAWSKKKKELLTSWITEEYSLLQTGVVFEGFGDCKGSPESDVILFYYRVNPLLAYFNPVEIGITDKLGPRVSSIEGHPDSSNAIAISNVGLYKSLILHEFGHALGLAHEHNHYKATNDGICEEINPRFHAKLEYTPYDAESVMNYCHMKKNKNASLSDGDRALLRALYR